MHDITSNIGIEQVLKPQTVQAAEATSGNIDCRGAESVAVVVLTGTIDDTLGASVRLDLKIEHADDNGNGAPASYAACTTADIANATIASGGIFASIDASTKDEKRYAVSYKGGKRFVKVTAVPVSLTNGGAVAMIALKGNLAQAPVSNA